VTIRLHNFVFDNFRDIKTETFLEFYFGNIDTLYIKTSYFPYVTIVMHFCLIVIALLL